MADASTFSFPLRSLPPSDPGRDVDRKRSTRQFPGHRPGHWLLNRFYGDDRNPLVRRWCDAEFMVEPNAAWPLILHGPPGVGKSALAETLASRLNGRTRRIAAGDFRRQFQSAVETRSIAAFRQRIHDCDLLWLEDLNVPADEKALVEEMTHCVDLCQHRHHPLIVTMATAPVQSKLPPALRSRLSAGLVIGLKRPGTAARREIVAELVRRLNLHLDESDVEWLVHNLPGTAPLIRSQLSQIAIRAEGGQLERGQLRRLLNQSSDGDFGSKHIEPLVRQVAKHSKQPVKEILGPSRRQEVVRARSIAMYLARHLLGASYREIGQQTGRRDRSTVRHACQQIERRIKTDTSLAEFIDQLSEQFQSKIDLEQGVIGGHPSRG